MKVTKFFKVFVFMLVFTIISPITFLSGSPVPAAAATVTISNKKLTLEVGQSETLKVIGTNRKVTWSSSNKLIASVSNKGKVTAVSAGNAIITATVNKKKYKCNVTVNDNSDVTNAPFEAQKIISGDFQYVIPKDWVISEDDTDGIDAFIIPSDAKNAEDNSSVDLNIFDTGVTLTDDSGIINYLYENTIQDEITTAYTNDLVNSNLISPDTNITYSDYNTSILEVKSGKVLKIEFNMAFDGIKRSEAMYYLYIENYCIMIITDDIDDDISPDAKTVGEYILATIKRKQ